MRQVFHVRVGPFGFRVGSAWRAPVAALESLYRDYPKPGIADFTVRLEATRPWRRLIRPSVAIRGDYKLAEAAPLPLSQGLLAAEMAMNLQVAMGARDHLLLHAAAVEREGRCLILTGESGAGKSTLAAMLGERGWRFMGDEFVLLRLADGRCHPFPRPISLKNAGIDALTVPAARFGPLIEGTPKGTIRHLRPGDAAIAAMDRPADPALIVFPRFGFARDVRGLRRSEAFVRLTQASTNYTQLGETGFATLAALVASSPAVAIDYPDGQGGIALIEDLWAAL